MVDVDDTRMLVWATIMEVGGDTMMAYRWPWVLSEEGLEKEKEEGDDQLCKSMSPNWRKEHDYCVLNI